MRITVRGMLIFCSLLAGLLAVEMSTGAGDDGGLSASITQHLGLTR